VLALKEAKGDQLIDIPIMLCGNKKDEYQVARQTIQVHAYYQRKNRAQKREVSTETGTKLAARWGCGFVETSAKNNENVTE